MFIPGISPALGAAQPYYTTVTLGGDTEVKAFASSPGSAAFRHNYPGNRFSSTHSTLFSGLGVQPVIRYVQEDAANAVKLEVIQEAIRRAVVEVKVGKTTVQTFKLGDYVSAEETQRIRASGYGTAAAVGSRALYFGQRAVRRLAVPFLLPPDATVDVLVHLPEELKTKLGAVDLAASNQAYDALDFRIVFRTYPAPANATLTTALGDQFSVAKPFGIDPGTTLPTIYQGRPLVSGSRTISFFEDKPARDPEFDNYDVLPFAQDREFVGMGFNLQGGLIETAADIDPLAILHELSQALVKVELVGQQTVEIIEEPLAGFFPFEAVRFDVAEDYDGGLTRVITMDAGRSKAMQPLAQPIFIPKGVRPEVTVELADHSALPTAAQYAAAAGVAQQYIFCQIQTTLG